MSQIAHLPGHLVNKIAAGEVIERPASVVKELMENSLDAAASRIDVEIAEGGKKLILVRDNGSGIKPDQLPLAVAAHATSKIANDEDLFRINTFGFRGEALASIASVSQLEITSRTPQAIEGARLEIAGGDQHPVVPAAALAGTQISIRNLFFNMPARRKFLRATNTEWGHIAEQFVRLAIAHCNVHLTLTHNSRKVHDLPADQSLRERIERLFSQELAQSLFSIGRAEGDIEISGLIAPPQHSRANAQWQYILLNNRHIRDRLVSHALREGYRGLMEIHRYPIVFLFLKIAPDRVDVNVHPAKSEVRFFDSNVVHSQVLASIRDRLLSSDLRPQVTLNAPAEQSEIQNQQQEGNQQQRVRQAIADFFQKTPSARHSTSPTAQSTGYGQTSFKPQPSAYESLRTPTIREGSLASPNRLLDVNYAKQDEAEVMNDPPEKFMQIHNTYLVAQSADGIVIIDQHALHERLIFEKLSQQIAHGPLQSQRCLLPEQVEVNDKQMAALQSAKGILKQLGIEAEPFGPRTIAIQSFPILLESLSPAKFVADLLDLLVSQSGHVSSEELIHKVLDMTACKAAIKAGDPLSHEEIESLLTQRPLVERSSNCPHGRPTTIHLSLEQMAKQFKRT